MLQSRLHLRDALAYDGVKLYQLLHIRDRMQNGRMRAATHARTYLR